MVGFHPVKSKGEHTESGLDKSKNGEMNGFGFKVKVIHKWEPFSRKI